MMEQCVNGSSVKCEGKGVIIHYTVYWQLSQGRHRAAPPQWPLARQLIRLRKCLVSSTQTILRDNTCCPALYCMPCFALLCLFVSFLFFYRVKRNSTGQTKVRQTYLVFGQSILQLQPTHHRQQLDDPHQRRDLDLLLSMQRRKRMLDAQMDGEKERKTKINKRLRNAIRRNKKKGATEKGRILQSARFACLPHQHIEAHTKGTKERRKGSHHVQCYVGTHCHT